jgi:two-component system, cell cycle response regulator DivK
MVRQRGMRVSPHDLIVTHAGDPSKTSALPLPNPVQPQRVTADTGSHNGASGTPIRLLPPLAVSDTTLSLDALRKLAAVGGPGFVQQMSTLFETHAPQRAAEILKAFADGELEAAARAAHALKGMAGNVGAEALYTIASAIEQSARAGRHEQFADQLAPLQAALEGTTAALRAAVSSLESEPSVTAPAPSPHSTNRPRLALVEDNPDNRLLVRALLEDRYDIDEYENGIDALDGLSLSLPDLVLLDISLPGMDGTEVLARMRSVPAWRDLPAIALTAHAMAGDRERFLGFGFDSYITKPIVDERVLIDAIDALLGARAH